MVISRIRDQEMKDRVLTQAMLGSIKDLSTLVDYCTAEESSRLTAPSTVGRMRESHFKRQKGQRLREEHQPPKQKEKCGHRGSVESREKSCRAYKLTCSKCQKKCHLANVCRSAKTQQNALIEEDATSPEEATNGAFGFLTVQDTTPSLDPEHPPNLDNLHPLVQSLRAQSNSPVTTVPLPHMVHEEHAGWLQRRPRPSPRVFVNLSVHLPSYAALSLAPPSPARV